MQTHIWFSTLVFPLGYIVALRSSLQIMVYHTTNALLSCNSPSYLFCFSCASTLAVAFLKYFYDKISLLCFKNSPIYNFYRQHLNHSTLFLHSSFWGWVQRCYHAIIRLITWPRYHSNQPPQIMLRCAHQTDHCRHQFVSLRNVLQTRPSCTRYLLHQNTSTIAVNASNELSSFHACHVSTTELNVSSSWKRCRQCLLSILIQNSLCCRF